VSKGARGWRAQGLGCRLTARAHEVLDAGLWLELTPGVLSCVDIIGFIVRDASSFLGGGRGVDFNMATGRLDGHISISSCTLDFLPPPTFNLSELVGSFPTKDLSIEDMVLIPDYQIQGGGTAYRRRMF